METNYWREQLPHEKYGNIYWPYHIIDQGWPAEKPFPVYGVMNKEGVALYHHLSWVDAIAIVQQKNTEEWRKDI